jgi:8-hydroxy-5-deazaflavin:NADPH oxidoreductase
MSYAIIGLGKIGTAIAQAFARQGIEVAVAGTRPLEALAALAAQIGPSLVPQRVEDAVKADIVILAMPFAARRNVARAAESWHGKIVVDATNALGVPPEELDGLPSTAAMAKALPGAKLVKAFNHLPAGTLAQGATTPQGGRRVVFVSSDDDAASASVTALVDRLGFAPVELGKIAEGGLLIQARGHTWARLIFQDLVKFDPSKPAGFRARAPGDPDNDNLSPDEMMGLLNSPR